MKKIYLIFFSLIISIFLTYLATNITYYSEARISPSNYDYDKVRGFPFELEKKFGPNTIIPQPDPINNTFNPYLLTFLFWFLGSLAFLLLLQHSKRKSLLIFTVVLAFFLMWIEMNTEGNCLKKGYPITLFYDCTDVNVAPPNNPVWFYYLLDSVFWVVITLFGTSALFYSYKSSHKKVRKFIPPLILTIYSLIFYQDNCGGFIGPCIIGRGLPFPFDNGNIFSFFIDYIFWIIIYNLIIFIKQQTEQSETQQVSTQITIPAHPENNKEEKNKT